MCDKIHETKGNMIKKQWKKQLPLSHLVFTTTRFTKYNLYLNFFLQQFVINY